VEVVNSTWYSNCIF